LKKPEKENLKSDGTKETQQRFKGNNSKIKTINWDKCMKF